jgi:predicted NAD-dependent protein-ADP-ribosyltransferase YbiA (DUF1768 family)
MTKKPKTAQATTVEIGFYRANEEPYGAFSNLYKRPIEFEGKIYPTSEHAYQAGKAIKPAVRDWILSAPTPALAAMAAHGLYVWDVVPNWATIKFDRMRAVLRAKCSCLRARLGLLKSVPSTTRSIGFGEKWGARAKICWASC